MTKEFIYFFIYYLIYSEKERVAPKGNACTRVRTQDTSNIVVLMWCDTSCFREYPGLHRVK